ncbi:MAG: hypothetical protein P8R42_18395 [Candidatus Binatia bacterium]|nr:hypothetical protein [Candidatus Binatia bacterium]
MKDPYSRGVGPPRAATQNGRRRGRAVTLAAGCLWIGVGAVAANAESSGGQMRRARFALARGADADAVVALDAVRRREPGSARGLEAALLLADLHFASGRSAQAETVLATASHRAPASIRSPIDLARGWLAISRGAASEARDRFESSRASPSSLARAVAEIGLAWASLGSGQDVDRLESLTALARAEGPLPARFAAGWTLARAHAQAGKHRRALRELRRLRRAVRSTSYEDDLELLLGLAQLEAGRARDARRTFKRLERRFGSNSSLGPVTTGLRLDDLRAPGPELARRVSSLYAGREPRSIGLIPFLGALFDRSAARDAATAVALAERAIDARKGDDR